MTAILPQAGAHDPLSIDAAAEVARICDFIRRELTGVLARRGLVVGVSGGVDSAVCVALAARAVGPTRVLALLMPERDSDSMSTELARRWATRLGVPYTVEDVTPALEGAGCYARRDAAIRHVAPAYGAGWRCKLVLPTGRLEHDRVNVTTLVVRPPGGDEIRVRLTGDVYRQIVAATNFKQRCRKMLEYYHADRLHYAVIGTPNRLEYDQGFFVKGGDGLADLKPIAHLYKTQVYQLAEYLGVPCEIVERSPTTDTFPMAQSQEEFYFSLPTRLLDRVLDAYNRRVESGEAAAELGLSADQVQRAYRDIAHKRQTTRYLHAPPLLVEHVLPPVD